MSFIRDTKGDTIIEVLLALTVLTAVLVGAYVTANRAQQASQAAQERSEAVKLAESQIERVKSLVSSATPPAIPAGSFCVKDDNTLENIGSPVNPFSEPLETATLPYEQSPGVAGACGNRDGRYNIAVRKDASETFSILVRWDRIGGNRDQINMYYRVH